VIVSASAIGFYGPAKDQWLTEESPPQDVFQSRLCVEREAAANAAEAQGIRAVNLRIGLVLGVYGGIFPRLALPARAGLAARIGDGKQWMSWIHIADLLRILDRVIDEPIWRGAVNAVAPAPERQADFQRALARACKRPFFLRIPAFALRLAMGEMAQLLVEGQRVAPRRLTQAGFEFRHFTLASALRDLVPDDTTPALRAADRDCEVWFNGDCPVCSWEIGGYAKVAERRDLPLRFHDSIRAPQSLKAYGLRLEHLERRLYLRDEQGRIVSGFRAVLALWARMPEYRRMGRVFSWPPLLALCEKIYDHLVAPGLAHWARIRQTGART
jgi:predicted DCC family thiol-disulfide oxidoreductase YuxK